MSGSRRVLFVQHAGAMGGSAMSLLYTARSLDPARYKPVIALARPSDVLHRLYADAGIETLDSPGLSLWDHSTVAPRPLHSPRTWIKLGRVATGWRRTAELTRALVERSRADVVHLNSMPLAPSAAALTEAGFPYVWHVREPPLPQRGPRYQMIRRIMLRADALIFISQADRAAWVGDAPAEVIHNFVDLSRFRPDVPADDVRQHFGIGADVPLILYLGGVSEAKGVFPLLDSLVQVRRDLPVVRCLMAGVDYVNGASLTPRWRAVARRLMRGSGLNEGFEARIRELGLQDTVVTAPFVSDVGPLIAASSVVVFPATRPHFARPAIEAAAMAKPVVASRFAVMEELVDHDHSGLLVEPENPAELAWALTRVLENENLAARMGTVGRSIALERFDSKRQIGRVMQVYDRLLRGRT